MAYQRHGACLATGGVASHRTAAVLLGVVNARPGRPEVTVDRNRRVRVDSHRVHRSTDLRPPPRHDDRRRYRPRRRCGWPWISGRSWRSRPTSGPWTISSPAGSSNGTRCSTLLGALSRRGRNGLGPARALLLERYGDDVPDSVLERAFLALVRGAGLPEPAAQVELADAAGFIARVDFAYPAVTVAIELDSRRHHLHADAFEADRAKRNRLQLLGWQVLSYTWEQVIRSGAERSSRQLTRGSLGI